MYNPQDNEPHYRDTEEFLPKGPLNEAGLVAVLSGRGLLTYEQKSAG